MQKKKEKVIRVFERLYIYLVACKEGFKAECRKLISSDGWFLRGEHNGYILVVVGIDGNNSIFRIAFVEVELENKSS